MLARIARVLASAVAAVWKTTVSTADDILNVALSPLRIIFGGRRGNVPSANFEPDVEPHDLLSELREQSARAAAVRELYRDGVRTVMQYAKATSAQRPTIDLAGLRKDVRSMLLTMDDVELKALHDAGVGAIRRFVDGKIHGVRGVSIVRPMPETQKTYTLDTPEQAVLRRVRQRLLAERTSEPFKSPNV